MRTTAALVTSWLALVGPAFTQANEQADFSKHGTAVVLAVVSAPPTWEPLDPDAINSLSLAAYRRRSSQLRDHALEILAGCPTGQTRVLETVGIAPVVGFEVTPAGMECLATHPEVGRIELGADRVASAERGRLSALSTADRLKIEHSLSNTGKARIAVQLRRVAVVDPQGRSEGLAKSRTLRRERRDRAVLDRLPGGSAQLERSLGSDHQDLIIDAAGLAALLRDPEVVAISVRE